MAQPKKVVKEEPKQLHTRGVEFACSKLLKKLRFSMTKEVFRMMIQNEKMYILRKKKSSKSTPKED